MGILKVKTENGYERVISTIATDKSLSIEGIAADAKITGDALNELSSLVGDTTVTEQINAALENSNFIPAPATATAGQYFKVSSVSDDGAVASVEAVDANDINPGVIKFEEKTATMPVSERWGSIAYGDGKFVAIAGYYPGKSSIKAAYSVDGIDWTETTLPSQKFWSCVVYGGDKFVAISQYSTVAAYSTDGITWESATIPSKRWESVTYGNGKFVVVSYSNDAALYSEDGITWTETTLPSSAGWYSVTYGDGKFVAINRSGGAAYTTDGVTWTASPITTNANYTTWRDITYGSGKFIAIMSSRNAGAYSSDGISWTIFSLPASYAWKSVAYGDGKFVVVSGDYNGSSGTASTAAMYSLDGISWTETTLPASQYWSDVVYGNNRFVAISNDSDVAAYSEDGINWINQYNYISKDSEDVTSGIKDLILDGNTPIPVPTTAQVGQFLKVSAVDENGRITAVEAVSITVDEDGVLTLG